MCRALAILSFAMLALVVQAEADQLRLQRMSAGKFARLPALHQAIDLANFDRELAGAAIFHETNRVRKQFELPVFRPLPGANEAAELQANMGAFTRTVSHHNPLRGLTTPLDRVESMGIRPAYVAENVALTSLANVGAASDYVIRHVDGRSKYFDSATGREAAPHTYASFAAAVVAQWMNSPGHRANILNRGLGHLGVSVRPTKGASGGEDLFSVQEFIALP